MRIHHSDPRTTGGPEPGFALGAALFALVVIAALVGGAFFAARHEFRVGRNHRLAEQALGAAEAGLVAALADGAAGRWRSVVAGESLGFTGSLPSGTGRFSGTVRRLNEQVFLVRSTGADLADQSERSVGALARLVPWPFRPPAALTVRGTLQVDGSAWIDGRDGTPPGWTDCPPIGADSVPGVLLRHLTDLQAEGCAGSTCITGAPRVRADSALVDDAALLERLGIDWAALVATADRVYSGAPAAPLTPVPVFSGLACDTSARDNWGEPQRGTLPAPCRNHFPVIFADGGLSLRGGRGQGVLLVQGDLDIAGGAEFVGLVVPTGRLRLGEGGGLLVGATLALNSTAGPSRLEGGAAVRLSTCAVAAAGRAASAVRPLRDRFWLDLY